MFAGLTGAWFIVGSFLALIDTLAVWWTVVVLVILALGLWGVGLAAVAAPGEADDVGSLDEPLTVLRVLLAVLVAVAAGLTFVDAPAALAGLAGAPLGRGRRAGTDTRVGRDHGRGGGTSLFPDRRLRSHRPVNRSLGGGTPRPSRRP